jgi:capsular exopolysaccharide synthesis family protein
MFEKRQALLPPAHHDQTLGFPAGVQERHLAQTQFTALDLWRVVLRRKWTILGFAAAVFVLSTVYAYMRTPVYEGIARIQIDPSRSTTLGLDDSERLPGAGSDTDSHVKTEVAILQSDAVAVRVMNALQLAANPHFADTETLKSGKTDVSELSPRQRQVLLTKFSNKLNVRVLPNTQVVEVRFRNADPALATRIANSVVDEYVKRNFLTRVDGSTQVSQWLSKQLEEIKANFSAAQQKLANFQRETNLLGTDESDNIVTNRLKQLNEELTQAEADRIVKEGRYRLARAGDPELIDSTLSNTRLQALRNQQADLQAQYGQLSSKYGSGYPRLRELQQQLVQLSAEIRNEGVNIETRLSNEYQASAKTEEMIRRDFEKQKDEAYRLNEHVAQYAILKHEVEAGQQLHDTLQLKLKTAGITSGLASSFVDVIDRAQEPDQPVEPRKRLCLALGLSGGLFGGLLLGLIRDSADDTVGEAEELETLVALPEIVSVPFLPILHKNGNVRKPTLRLLSGHSSFNPLVLRYPASPAAESYRALCSFVLLAAGRDLTKTLVITSATPGEGKSTVSCNLATALAQRGRKVLLVDADLRCSSLQPRIGIRPGLSALCIDPETEQVRSQPVARVPTLHVVPAGVRPIDPTRVLDSARMQELMNEWRQQYDHIIIDTPPLLPFADARILASRADAVILVVRAAMSRTKAVLRARDLLHRSGANLAGFVLNAVRERESYYEYPKAYQLVAEKEGQERADA